MYDYAHPPSDAIELVTHSLCTLEFEDHRPLYDWLVETLPVPSRPRQIEFARLNLNYTVMSKRKLLRLVTEGHMRGWDDPRMPTIAALRRRGYTPAAIRNFAERVGVARRENVIDVGFLEFCVREDLNKVSPRVMGVLASAEGRDYELRRNGEEFETPNNPEDPSMGRGACRSRR
jgi:glutaminyl-tRNA synthetase